MCQWVDTQGDLKLSNLMLWTHNKKKQKASRLQNPSMRAVAKILQAQASKDSLIFASNSSKCQILWAILNWIGPFNTPKLFPVIFIQQEQYT